MEYSINKLSKMSGVSARTLRYYDEIGLLKPVRVASSGYRIYGRDEVNMLQQILLYRELGFQLEDIKTLLSKPDFDRVKAFEKHLIELNNKKERIEELINNVSSSISAMKGEKEMSDKEKFEGFKEKLISDNEEKYGKEIREKHGDKSIDESNENLRGVTKEQYDKAEQILKGFEIALEESFKIGDPSAELAQKAVDLHRQWLCVFYPRYTKDYHMGLGEMYVADERFRVNYDKFGKGCTEFLRDAIDIYCTK